MRKKISGLYLGGLNQQQNGIKGTPQRFATSLEKNNLNSGWKDDPHR